MNLICPNCQRMLQVADQFAGQVLKCEHCAAAYSVPVLPQAPAFSAVSPPSSSGPPQEESATRGSPAGGEPDLYRLEPPGPNGPGSQAAPPRMDGIPLPQLVAGYQHLHSIWIKPEVVKWLAPAALALVFILLFFPWIVPLEKPAEQLTGWETAFGRRSNGFGTIFGLLFLLSFAMAIAAVVLPRLPPERLHPKLREFLPWRAAAVFGLTAFAFLFFALQIAMGFGSENEPSLGRGWFRLALLAEIVAVAGAGLNWWLTLRGPQLPLPRIDVSW